MASIGLEYGDYSLHDRNQLAQRAISQYATMHASADVGIGLLGFLPFPGAGPASIIASLGLQIPIYRLLAGELQMIYSKPSMDFGVKRIVNSGVVVGSAAILGKNVLVDPLIDLAADAGVDMTQQFGMEFLQQIGGELLQEIIVGFGIAFIPILGGLVSTSLDVMIAITMTWRVGTMISIYYQNGQQWVGNKHETYEYAKKLTGGMSMENQGRVDLNSIATKIDKLKDYQSSTLAQFVKSLLEVAPDLTDSTIRSKLRAMNVPPELIEAVIRKVRS